MVELLSDWRSCPCSSSNSDASVWQGDIYGEKEQFIETSEVCLLSSEPLLENCYLSKCTDANAICANL